MSINKITIFVLSLHVWTYSTEIINIITELSQLIEYEVVRFESKVFRRGKVIKLVPKNATIGYRMNYVFGTDTTEFNDLFPLTNHCKLNKYNDIIISNEHTLSKRTVYAFLSELFGFHNLRMISSINELEKIIYESEEEHSLDIEKLKRVILSSNNNFTKGVLNSEYLLFKEFPVSISSGGEYECNNKLKAFYKAKISLNNNGTIRSFVIECLGSLSD